MTLSVSSLQTLPTGVQTGTTAWGLEFPHSVSPLMKMVGPMMWNNRIGAISNPLRDWFESVESKDGVVVISFGTNFNISRR